jgi:hypothetical protein
MEPIIKINQIVGKDETTMSYRVTITQGDELIKTQDELINYLNGSFPYKKGIIEVNQLSSNLWVIKTNK